jgi:hypothetical protein
VAGEEGFEPPLSVLETDGLPLNLLPFTLSGSQRLPRRVYPWTFTRVPFALLKPGNQIQFLLSIPALPFDFSLTCREAIRKLLHFLVTGVLAARIAKLLRLHPVGVLLPILGGRVIPIFAIVALQCDDFAHRISSNFTKNVTR